MWLLQPIMQGCHQENLVVQHYLCTGMYIDNLKLGQH